MTRTSTLPVKSDLMRWARESAGMSVREAAKTLGIRAKTLEQWEAIEARPTARQLERLADVYRRPMASFFMSSPPSEPPLPADFRVFPSDEDRKLSSATRFAARRARRLQRVFAELARDFPRAVPTESISAQLTERPEVVVARARALIGIYLDEQLSWRDPRIALREWRRAVERTGVLVFQFSMPLKEVRGFCFSGDVPAVVLNSKDSYTGRIFTLFHEWGHLFLHKPGICIPEEDMAELGYLRSAVQQTNQVEVFCNAFSGNFLAPADGLSEHPDFRAYVERKTSLAQALTSLSQDFSVSRHVILRRLLTIGFVSKAEYQQTVERWKQLFGAPRKPKKASGGPSPPVRVVSELGPTFVGRVVEAFDRGIIDYSDVADYLSIRVKHLSRVHAVLPPQY